MRTMVVADHAMNARPDPVIAGLADIASKVESWLFAAALPLWRRAGLDAQGFAVEELNFHGAARERGYRRTLVQFRQAYCFAHASLIDPGDAQRALGLMRNAARHAWHPEGGWVHRLSPGGDVLDATRETYDQAFAVFAAAWVYRVSGDMAMLELADRTLAFLDTQMADPGGGYAEALPPKLPRRQNPHMHLLEGVLALYDATGKSTYLARADALLELLLQHFVDPAGYLHEFFDAAWNVWPGIDGEMIEPGHHFEWVWLLHEHARLSCRAVLPVTGQLFRIACAHGLKDGLVVARIDDGGVIADAGSMLWAQCEALKSYVARSEHAGEDHRGSMCAVLDDIFRHFLPQQPGGIWYEKLDANHAPVLTRMPATGFYHLMLAMMEFLRYAGRVDRAPRGGWFAS